MIFFWIGFGLLVGLMLGAILYGLPYVPTLQRDIDKLFDELKIGKSDHLVDLGSGDGRVMLAAAKRGAVVSGVEINPFLVLIARFRLRRFGKKASLRVGNMFKYQIPNEATHIFMFTNARFMKKIEKNLLDFVSSNSVTIISYGFELPGIKRQSITLGPFVIYEL